MNAIVRSRLAICLVVAIAISLRVLAYSPFDISHPDELMQYLEQGNRLATGRGILAWETRYGVRNNLIPQFLALPLWLGHALAPGTIAHLHLARLAFGALTLLSLPAAWKLGALVSRRHAFVAFFVAATWWESVLFSNLLLSESLASVVLLLAAPALLDPSPTPRRSIKAAFLLGCGVLLRFQYAPFALMLFTWALVRNPKPWRCYLLGGFAAALAGAISDLVADATPFSWVIINFSKNIGEGVAARFGTSPVWQYLYDYYIHLGPGALLLAIIAAAASGSKYRPLLAAAIFNVAIHSLVLHKEYRFVWLSTLVLLVLAAIGSLRIADKLLGRRYQGKAAERLAVLIATVGWALMSAASFHVTGGYQAFRGGGVLSRLAITAAERADVCGIAVIDIYYGYVLPSLLPRDIPLSIAPATTYDLRKGLPKELESAANALISDDHSIAPGAYQKVSCLGLPEESACLYVRRGGCDHNSTYDYQRMLTGIGM